MADGQVATFRNQRLVRPSREVQRPRRRGRPSASSRLRRPGHEKPRRRFPRRSEPDHVGPDQGIPITSPTVIEGRPPSDGASSDFCVRDRWPLQHRDSENLVESLVQVRPVVEGLNWCGASPHAESGELPPGGVDLSGGSLSFSCVVRDELLHYHHWNIERERRRERLNADEFEQQPCAQPVTLNLVGIENDCGHDLDGHSLSMIGPAPDLRVRKPMRPPGAAS